MAKERTLYRCPLCAKISPIQAFEAGERGDDTHALEARTCRFEGGGRAGRRKVEVEGEDGTKRLVLERDAQGKPIAGPGFAWSRRDLTPNERADMVGILRAVANRETLDFVRDVLTHAGPREFEQWRDQFLAEAEEEHAQRVELINRLAEKRYFDD